MAFSNDLRPCLYSGVLRVKTSAFGLVEGQATYTLAQNKERRWNEPNTSLQNVGKEMNTGWAANRMGPECRERFVYDHFK